MPRLRERLRPRTRVRGWLASRMRVHNYVAIRFSLRMDARWTQKAYGDEAGREAWFAMRAALFTATAAASLRRQTVQPRRVLVLMDTGDEALWRRHLDLPAPFVPVFVEAEALGPAIAERVRSDHVRDVVVSRLDSDDAVSDDYLEQVNRSARDARRGGRQVASIVACRGFVTDLDNLQELDYNCSPFISIYAHRYRGEGVYDLEHEQILDQDPLLNRTARWMQVVHGSNVANRLRTRSRFPPGDPRRMTLGGIRPVESSWPAGFAPELLPRARAARAHPQGTTGTSSPGAGTDGTPRPARAAAS